jgi:lipopolysaccharide assembly outer membrane protein LptD (OstA)
VTRLSHLPQWTVAALLAFGLVLGAAVPSGVAAAAGGAPAPLSYPLHLTADEVTVDNTGSALVATGHVRVTYGADVATADSLRLTREAHTAALSGHVTVVGPEGQATADHVTLDLSADNQVTQVTLAGAAGVQTPQYALSADSIVADRPAGRLIADGHVTAFSAPDLIINGGRLVYNQHEEYGVITGQPVIANKAGRMQGDWIELFRKDNRAIVHGPVRADVYGATVTSDNANVNFGTSVAVLTGRVVMVRTQGTLWADQVTIFYETRQMIAVGTTRVHFNNLSDAANP